MIVYFAGRQLNILGQASTELPAGLTIIEDLKTEDVETGVAVFEFKIPFDKKTRMLVETYAEVGNYILRSADGETELYTIIEAEIDTKNQEVYIYAEDDGMDLLNEVATAYEADKAYPIAHYINMYAASAGFEIGVNEAASLTRKLKWEGESTKAERIASIATQFDGCEVSYSFDVNGLTVTKKYINIYKERGKDVGTPLRLNKEVDRIVTIKSIANLATALQCSGATPEDDNVEDDIEPQPITLEGYKYDDGDFYVDGAILKSRQALKRWSRYLWKNEQAKKAGGHIVKPFSYDTLSQQTLLSHAITELKRIRDMEVNYEADINKLPDNTKIGDRISIVDDDGELYLSTRILKLETSEADKTYKATLGEFLIKGSGISQKVAELAAQFAATSVSAARASAIANNAYDTANYAQTQVDTAIEDAEKAQQAAAEATAAVEVAKESAANAQKAADDAQALVVDVGERITSLETSVNNAQLAADNAQLAADSAHAKADEAAEAAEQAKQDAADAKEAAEEAVDTASTANTAAAEAKTTAETAKTDAATAQATAEAAKADAEQAQKDIDDLKNSLETLTNTMTADFVRTTDLTETTASLESQISQNAAQINSAVSQISTIDETANNAKEQAQAAQATAATAQSQADQATANAQAAQTAADEAAAAATAAQNEADTAKAAAATAQSVADKAEADLEAAKADLATVSSRVNATEEEIAAAQKAVEAAQTAADTAKADASAAEKKAVDAQSTADTAVTNAANAQTVANNAASQAALAQQVAEQAKGDAEAAQTRADEAATVAAEAQRTANTAVTNAANAQAQADAAAQAAEEAQAAADDADAKAAAAAADLATAKQNLVDVVGRVDATEADIEEAKNAVITAQAAADKAKEDAEAAQATADTAKANAATAQTAANNAKTAADNAQAAADEAQKAADDAQAAVDALAVRVTTAETNITQNAEQIALRAKKTEVVEMLGGYSTKEETEAAIQLESDSIKSTVSGTYATKQEVKNIEVGGRNLAINSASNYESPGFNVPTSTIAGENDYTITEETYNKTKVAKWSGSATSIYSGPYFGITSHLGIVLEVGRVYTMSAWIKADVETTIRATSLVEGQTVLSSKVDVGTEWNRVFVVFEAAKTDGNFCFYTAANATTDAPYIYMCGIKVEHGNKATDWTPAPEDVDSDIEAAQSTADDASESATTANERVTTAESLIQQLSNCIAMLVTDENGESLMTQTENGWTFSMKETAEAVSSLTSLLETLQQEAGSTQATVDVLKQAINDHGKTLEYVTVTTYEDEPCIELGESDSNFKLMITNTRIMFMNGANVPTYINTNGIVTQNIEVKGEIVQGGYVMLNTSDGGWGLLWKGVTS